MSILAILKSILMEIISPETFPIISIKYRYNFKYRLRKLFYYGNKNYCPCCGRFIRKFAPFGVPKRQNAECPFCYVMERHRLLFLYLKKKTNFFQERLKVLDVGPELYLEFFFRSMDNLSYLSIDLNPDNAMVQMDVTNIKLVDNTFDFILCISVIEHVVNDKKALSELFRVLKPGGFAIIDVPINYELQQTIMLIAEYEMKKHDKDFHVRDYGPDFLELLKKIGFEVYQISYKKELSSKMINYFGLMNCEDKLYISQKPMINNRDKSDMSKFKIFS